MIKNQFPCPSCISRTDWRKMLLQYLLRYMILVSRIVAYEIREFAIQDNDIISDHCDLITTLTDHVSLSDESGATHSHLDLLNSNSRQNVDASSEKKIILT